MKSRLNLGRVGNSSWSPDPLTTYILSISIMIGKFTTREGSVKARLSLLATPIRDSLSATSSGRLVRRADSQEDSHPLPSRKRLFSSPVTSQVNNERDGMQTTKVALAVSQRQSGARGKSPMVNISELLLKLRNHEKMSMSRYAQNLTTAVSELKEWCKCSAN